MFRKNFTHKVTKVTKISSEMFHLNSDEKWCRQWGPPHYDEVVVGDYMADILVEDEVLVELKAVQELDDVHTAQCLNYLHGTGKKIDGLVDRFPASQRKMMLLMMKTPAISKKDMSVNLGISTTAIDKNIAQLKRKGVLRRVGPDKGGYWEILRKG